MEEAIDLVAAAFSQFSRGKAQIPQRTVITVDQHGGRLLYMPGLLTETGSLALKAVGIYENNPRRGKPTVIGVVLVHDAETGEPQAVMEGSYLTALRTGAAGGLAARLLARPDSEVLAVFGAGVQARAQIEAARLVLPIKKMLISSLLGAEDLADELREDSCIDVATASSATKAVCEADVVITATTSVEPVFDGRRLRAGCHVTAIGAFTPETRELDDATVAGAKIVVDSRSACFAEAGDILIPLRSEVITETSIYAELGEIVAGLAPGREDINERTIFKSVGIAAQDAIIAQRVVERANELALGINVDLGP